MTNLLRTTLATAATGLCLCSFFCGQVQAASSIQGEIDFGGVVTFNTTSLATATEVDLWQPLQNGPSNFSRVLQRSGDFANPTFNINAGDSAAMAAPWIFNSGTVATPLPGPATNALWSIGGFTFNLTSSTVVSQSATFLDITGVGTITGNGFNATPGTWSFTATQADGSSNPNFSFQASTVAVPEPGTLTLLGLGAGAFARGKLRRRKGA
jgi:hypothetical protein